MTIKENKGMKCPEERERGFKCECICVCVPVCVPVWSGGWKSVEGFEWYPLWGKKKSLHTSISGTQQGSKRTSLKAVEVVQAREELEENQRHFFTEGGRVCFYSQAQVFSWWEGRVMLGVKLDTGSESFLR